MTILDTNCPFLAKSPYKICIIRSATKISRSSRGDQDHHRSAMVHNVVYNSWFTFYNIKPSNYNFVKSYLGLRPIAGSVPRN